MSYSHRRNMDSGITADDPVDAEAYGSAHESEINILYRLNYADEQANIQDNVLVSDGNMCSDLVFVDGNDGDLEACEYEDTLMERVWRSCRPPKIPRQATVVPARRIQVMKERLSPTIKGLPSPTEASSDEIKKQGNRRHKIKSDVHYVRIINYLGDENQTVTSNCARKLEDLL